MISFTSTDLWPGEDWNFVFGQASFEKPVGVWSLHRLGDPAAGGSTRKPIMTAYRQQALACADVLAKGPARPRDLKLFYPDAAKILHRNVYGWFFRQERGIYALTDGGRAALLQWSEQQIAAE